MISPRLSFALACGAFALFAAPPVFAQATRTWVSAVGDDANPCSRTAPCQTFAGAIVKTAAGGRIDILDAGDYGPVTINKALTLSGEGGGLGAAVATGASVVNVTGGPNDVVVLHHLALRGSGSGSNSGISFTSGKALHIEGCTITGFPGDGIHFEPSASGQLIVSEVRAAENGGAGLFAASTAGAAQVTVVRSRFERNAFGLLARDGGKVAVYDSNFSGNSDTGVAVLPLTARPAEANLEGATLSADNVALRAEGANALVRFSKTTVLDPVTAASQVASGGRLLSFGNNRLLAPVAGDLCTGVTCAAPNGCQEPGVCNHFTGTCEYEPRPDGLACDDGNACTQTDACVRGVCAGTHPIQCGALDACHLAGSCEPATGVCSTPAQPDGAGCDDSDACTQQDSCLAGVCVGTNPVRCDADDACHLDGTCNPATGLCANPEAADGTACDDGNLCTAIGSCSAGSCTGQKPVSCVATDPCQQPSGTCDPGTGTCSYLAQPDGTACDDGNACTRVDSCQAGECAGAEPVDCPVADQCLTGSCDPATGACQTAARGDGTPCSDGTCIAGACSAAEEDTGCGCTTSGSPPSVAGLLALVSSGLMLVRRRRRH